VALSISIRPATAADLPAINAIYNHYVLHSTATYQTEPETPGDRAAWFAQHRENHPIIVAESGGETVGWGSLSPFHRRAAYARTVENSVYVRHDRQRQGIGRAILEILIELARMSGHHAIVALIDAEQAGSIALHASEGFEEVGRLKEVGNKYGKWLDVVYMQLIV